MKIDFAIGTAASSDIMVSTVECVEAARWYFMNRGLMFPWFFAPKNSLCQSRNVLLARFLKETEAPYFIIIDRDMVFTSEDLDKLYHDMLDGYDYINGLYPLRDRTFFASHIPASGKPWQVNGGIQEFDYIGNGFMGISRRALEKIRDELSLPELFPSGDSYWPFYEETARLPREGREEAIFTGDDWELCEKAREVGIKRYTDTSIHLGHYGSHLFTVEDTLKNIGEINADL